MTKRLALRPVPAIIAPTMLSLCSAATRLAPGYLATLALPLLAACGDRHLDAPFVDSFARDTPGADYLDTGGGYRVESGHLAVANAHNHPLWLKRRLPNDVRLDVDVTPLSAEGDVKVELYGDGQSFESDEGVKKDVQYTDTGYIFIFGGWNNHVSTLVREAEHAWQRDPGVPRRTDVRVVPHRTYHWTIFKRGGHLAWFVDGQPFLAWDDPVPLQGPGHDHFCFTGWEAAAEYTNLRIAPLAAKEPLTP